MASRIANALFKTTKTTITVGRCAALCRFASYQAHIDLHPQVQRALQRGEPVVALESTIITHGMPHPQNIETAREVEHLVRTNGALPATIAIMDGRIKVGLADDDLQLLSAKRQDEVIKCSRRDLASLVAQRASGGTTVAATMIIARMAGVRVFATGGVGGVHRDGHISMDVSADLVELGRTPMAVVCSGVKSILDIPRTLEYLETQGVCVAAYGTDDGCFPDFYTRDSGCKVPHNLRDATEAARLIKALHDLELKSGILIGVPIPEAFAADKQLIKAAIDEAYQQAQEAGVAGKDVTPFLLAAIAKITGGNSLEANMALIKNNAAVAAQIACELCNQQQQTKNQSFSVAAAADTTKVTDTTSTPLIIGASILDLSLTMLDDMPERLDGATYHTHAKQSAGGVGRNLAEGIFKLHGAANLISVVGADQMGKSLLQLIPEPLQAGVLIDAEKATSLCSVIFDKAGDCKLILGNMEIHQTLTPQRVQREAHLLRSAPLIIMDSNLPLPTMEYILTQAHQHQRPVFFEPTDMRIAGRPFALPRALTQQIKIISPNIYELKTIVEAITEKPVSWSTADIVNESSATLVERTKELLALIEERFDCVLVTLGHHGVLLSVRGGVDSPLFDKQTGKYLIKSDEQATELKHTPQQSRMLRFYAAPQVRSVTNVSGAGDSYSSGFITGLLRGYKVERCVALGFIAAERALLSESAVPVCYFSDPQEEATILRKTFEGLTKIDI